MNDQGDNSPSKSSSSKSITKKQMRKSVKKKQKPQRTTDIRVIASTPGDAGVDIPPPSADNSKKIADRLVELAEDNPNGIVSEIDQIDGMLDTLRVARSRIISEISNGSGNIDRARVSDLTDGFKEHYGTEKIYTFPSEQSLAKYAVTKMANEFGIDARNSKNFALPPSHCTINTDVNQQTVVFEDITTNIKIKMGDDKTYIHGTIQAIQMRDSYGVVFVAESKEALLEIEDKYNKILEYNNYYQGKTLRFSANGVVFIPSPEMTLEEAVLPPKVINEYRVNCLDFLSDERYHDITKKRALLLYGPPGGGKTTSLKALFSLLRNESITCMYMTDDTFKRNSLESIFDFINKYLAPCCIGFEDIDLIGEDRRNSRGIIGSLLSVLNGVEDYKKPIVIVGTTNRAEILDDAVTRPCRFDRKIFIDFPTTEALRMMFKNMTGKDAPDSICQSEDANNKLTGAHVKEICNTAQILSLRNDKDVLECVDEAVATIKESFYLASSVTGFSSPDEAEAEVHSSMEDEICEEQIDPAESREDAFNKYDGSGSDVGGGPIGNVGGVRT